MTDQSTNSMMSCDEFADRLADFLERDVDERTRSAMEAHGVSCAECGPLLADLRRLRIDAANLPELTPSRDLWAGVAERIETPVVSIGAGAAAGRGASLVGRWRTGLAAAGLVALTATVTYQVTYQVTKRGDTAPVATVNPASNAAANPAANPAAKTAAKAAASGASPIAPPPASVVASVASTKQPASARPAPKSGANAPQAFVANTGTRSADATYDVEISRLRAIIAKRRSQLDSSTVAVIEHNLTVIDDAITQCRQALRKDPASRFLLESLNDALDTKVQLLRTAASLPARSS